MFRYDAKPCVCSGNSESIFHIATLFICCWSLWSPEIWSIHAWTSTSTSATGAVAFGKKWLVEFVAWLCLHAVPNLIKTSSLLFPSSPPFFPCSAHWCCFSTAVEKKSNTSKRLARRSCPARRMGDDNFVVEYIDVAPIAEEVSTVVTGFPIYNYLYPAVR